MSPVRFSELKARGVPVSNRERAVGGGGRKPRPGLRFEELREAEELEAPIDKAEEEKEEDLYQKTFLYYNHVLSSVRQGIDFSLQTGFEIITRVVAALERRDTLYVQALYAKGPLDFLAEHCVNTAIYSIKMGATLEFARQQRVELGMVGLFHDVGKARIDEGILYKTGRLSKEELETLRKVPAYGYDLLKTFGPQYRYLAECTLQVYERLDGSGYPRGLKGDEIHEYAQIVGLVDVYEALTHTRPQREKYLHFTAVKEIIKSGKKLFLRSHLKALLNSFSVFPIQSYVKLNSNAIARVIETYPDQPMRPKVQIISDAQGRRVWTDHIVNLPDNPLLHIVDSVSEPELTETKPGGRRHETTA